MALARSLAPGRNVGRPTFALPTLRSIKRLPLATSQTPIGAPARRMGPLPAMRYLPSGLKAVGPDHLSGLATADFSSPVLTTQALIVLPPTLTRVLPSGANARPSSLAPCPSRVRSKLRDSMSQS